VLKVLTGQEDETQMERFLAASVRTLERLGVPAEARLRRGAVVEEIQAELASGGYGLLVVGSPLATGPAGLALLGRVPLHGVVQRLVTEASRPLLIVRSRRKAA
jgi:nucleotide-binding universal stress UspA family protein